MRAARNDSGIGILGVNLRLRVATPSGHLSRLSRGIRSSGYLTGLEGCPSTCPSSLHTLQRATYPRASRGSLAEHSDPSGQSVGTLCLPGNRPSPLHSWMARSRSNRKTYPAAYRQQQGLDSEETVLRLPSATPIDAALPASGQAFHAWEADDDSWRC